MAKKFQLDTWWTLLTSLAKFWNWNWTSFDIGSNSFDTWTYNSTTWLAWNNAQSFNGTSTYRINAPDDTEYPSWGDYSINLWVNLTSLPTSWNLQSILNKYDGWGNPWWYDFWLYNNAWTQQFWTGFVNSSWNWQFNTNNYTLATNTWLMLTSVLSWTSLSTYVNNTLLSTSTVTGTPANNTKRLYLWWFWFYTPSWTDLWRFINWKVCLVWIWSKALSPTERTDLYNSWTGNGIINVNPNWMFAFFLS